MLHDTYIKNVRYHDNFSVSYRTLISIIQLITLIIIEIPKILSLSYQSVISKLTKCFNNKRNTNYHANNASNGVALLQPIYFKATAVAQSVLIAMQNKLHIN